MNDAVNSSRCYIMSHRLTNSNPTSMKSPSKDISAVNVGALRIRLGLWGFLIIITVEYTPRTLF